MLNGVVKQINEIRRLKYFFLGKEMRAVFGQSKEKRLKSNRSETIWRRKDGQNRLIKFV